MIKGESMKKKALLLVHFGTTNKEARKKSLDGIKEYVEQEFKDYDIKESYTSRLIIKNIFLKSKKRYLTPKESLLELKESGYEEVVIQATHVINGIERDHLVSEINEFKNEFKSIKVGSPLLTSFEDYKVIRDLILKEFEEDESVILVGHGTEHHSFASYGMLENMFSRSNRDNILVGCIEGDFDYKEVENIIKRKNIKEVKLLPLMIVAGVHARDDIAGDWKEWLGDIGIEATAILKGLGEYKEIKELLASHIKEAIEEEVEDIAKIKEEILREVTV